MQIKSTKEGPVPGAVFGVSTAEKRTRRGDFSASETTQARKTAAPGPSEARTAEALCPGQYPKRDSPHAAHPQFPRQKARVRGACPDPR